MEINSLLNASPCPTNYPQGASSSLTRGPHPTPDYTSKATSAASTPSPSTPLFGTAVNLLQKVSKDKVVKDKASKGKTGKEKVVKEKVSKDAAVFIPGQAKQPVNFSPYESNYSIGLGWMTHEERETLREEHKKFQIYPSGGVEGSISSFTRHIPYNSDKKSFFHKTGREGFEVFQYTFRMPHEPSKEYVVMWDYQIGLTRVTPFFKSLDYPKTTPNKVLKDNIGLRELSHSITGGAIAAQGYWMPYGCARAVCATFCYSIRYALTPIFGTSFIDDCLDPKDPEFGQFAISPEVIRASQREYEGWNVRAGPDGQMSTMGTGFMGTVTSAHSDLASAPAVSSTLGKKRRSGARKPKANVQPKAESDSTTNTGGDYTNGRTMRASIRNSTGIRRSARIAFADSPDVSPKTLPNVLPAPRWTAINAVQVSPPLTPIAPVAHMGGPTQVRAPASAAFINTAATSYGRYSYKANKTGTMMQQDTPPTPTSGYLSSTNAHGKRPLSAISTENYDTETTITSPSTAAGAPEKRPRPDIAVIQYYTAEDWDVVETLAQMPFSVNGRYVGSGTQSGHSHGGERTPYHAEADTGPGAGVDDDSENAGRVARMRFFAPVVPAGDRRMTE